MVIKVTLSEILKKVKEKSAKADSALSENKPEEAEELLDTAEALINEGEHFLKKEKEEETKKDGEEKEQDEKKLSEEKEGEKN